MTRPNNPRIQIDSAFAARYLVMDYDPLMPVAPGVVLIKAPGHTPGSQLVYVRLASGSELIIAGDVAWHMSGIETQQHKPESATSSFGGEDRRAIEKQLRWLLEVAESRIEVLVSHDVKRLNALIDQGQLVSGFDLRTR
jgi:glyoxylase-like metal-dependent hydrolase (beta-lactamase superfamily II)